MRPLCFHNLNRNIVHLILTIFVLLELAIGIRLDESSDEIPEYAYSKYVFDQEFSKDISSIIVEATLASTCDANVFISTRTCEEYINSAIHALSNWAPPVLITSIDFKLNQKTSAGPTRREEQWTKYLAWKKKPCNLIFVCGLHTFFLPPTLPPPEIEEFGSGEGYYNLTNSTTENVEETLKLTNMNTITISEKGESENELTESTGFFHMPNFITNLDEILHLSENDNLTCASDDDLDTKLLHQSGILLTIKVENRSRGAESLMRVHSKCSFCGQCKQEQNLGNWQRNKTQFGKFFPVFDDSRRGTFHGHNLSVGYFNYPPHFSCTQSPGHSGIVSRNGSILCRGVEWDMLNQMSKSLNFVYSLVNFTGNNEQYSDNGVNGGSTTNITRMVEALTNGTIDMVMGGISITPERKQFLQFSKIFANEPIVFVVRKRNDIYILGIWLAFQPQVWPLIILLVTIMAVILRYIVNKMTEIPSNILLLLEYRLIDEGKSMKSVINKMSMLKALEKTVLPLIGQPIASPKVLVKNPRGLLKLLLAIWWFVCLIISTLYNTSLITSLINPVTPAEPESLRELINYGYKFKLGCKHGAVAELLSLQPSDSEDSAEERNPKMIKFINDIRSRLWLGSTNANARVAYVVEDSSVEEINWSDSSVGFPLIKIIPERLFLTGYAWPVQRFASFRPKIDTALSRLAAAGLIEHWTSRKHKEPQLERKFRLRKKLGQIHLDLEILQGAFVFLALGCFVAGICFFLEKLREKYTFRFFTVVEIKAAWKTVEKYLEKRNVRIEPFEFHQKYSFQDTVRSVLDLKSKLPFPYLK